MPTNKSKDKFWREFEQLIARIEKQLAPKGAIIRSPDRIRDKVTGRLREVDASIRYQVGSVPILITIECRRRSKVQDDTWIEQLATKKGKIGAQQTIAVSSTGFTDSAVETARHYGIELRKIDDITDTVIADWIKDILIEKLTVHDTIVNWSIELESENEDVKFHPEIENALQKNLNDSVVLFRYEDNLGISINALLENVFRWQSLGELGQESYVGLAGEHSEVGRRITLEFTPNHFYTITNVGKAMVYKVVIDLHTRIKREFVPLNRVYQYSDMNNAITQIAVSSISLGNNLEEKLSIYVQPSEDNNADESPS